MEILQTVWTALTTPNANLVAFIIFPLSFLESFMFMLLFTTIFDITSTKKQKIIYICLASIIGTSLRVFVPAPYGTFINVVFMILSVKFVFKLNWLKSILCLFIPFALIIFSETIITKIYYLLFCQEATTILNIPIGRISVNLILYFIVFVAYFLVKYYKVNLAKLDILSKKKRSLLILSTIFGIVLIAGQLYLFTFYELPVFMVLINLLALVSYFVISLYTIFTVGQLETTSINLEEEKLYNKTLEILQDNTRAFRHDFGNIVQGIGGYVNTNDMEGLKKYYSQLLQDCQRVNNLSTLSPKVVNNPAIYNILASKYHKADEKGIEINLEVFIDLNQLHMKIYEFTRVLGILMDNAIEATAECEEKRINVIFRSDERRHMQLLIIENTYKNKDVDTEKIYEKGFSTKEGNSGLGLWEIRQILKKNNNLNLFTTKNNEFFRQQFEILF